MFLSVVLMDNMDNGCKEVLMDKQKVYKVFIKRIFSIRPYLYYINTDFWSFYSTDELARTMESFNLLKKKFNYKKLNTQKIVLFEYF